MHKNFDIHFLFLFYFKSSSTRIKPETMLSLALISSIIFSVTKAFYRMFFQLKNATRHFALFYHQLFKTEQLFKQTGSFTLLLIQAMGSERSGQCLITGSRWTTWSRMGAGFLFFFCKIKGSRRIYHLTSRVNIKG